jgi:hypothetical protein
MSTNKFIYLNVLQGNYGHGHGWEDLCQSENRAEVRADLSAYRENAPEYAYRIIRRREINA